MFYVVAVVSVVSVAALSYYFESCVFGDLFPPVTVVFDYFRSLLSLFGVADYASSRHLLFSLCFCFFFVFSSFQLYSTLLVCRDDLLSAGCCCCPIVVAVVEDCASFVAVATGVSLLVCSLTLVAKCRTSDLSSFF